MRRKINKLKTNAEFMRYFNNTSWLFLDKLIKMGVGFFVIIYLTRYLGPELFGLLSYAQSFVGIFAAFATLGIDAILVRELTKRNQNEDELIGTAFTLKVVASIIGIFTVFVINLGITDRDAALLTNIISLMLLFQCPNCLDSYFQAKIKSKYSAISNSVAFIVSSALKLGLVYFEAHIEYFAYSLVFDAMLIAVGYLIIYKHQNKSFFKLKFNKKIAFYFIKNGWPLMMVTMAAFIYTRTGQVMIKYMIGNQAVGYYASAARVSELFYFIPLLITQSIFPKIIEIKSKSEQEYFDFLERLYRLLIWLVLPIAIGLFVFSEAIVRILYGKEYSEASGVLSILAFGIVFNAIGTVSTKILYVEHYERKYLYRSVMGVFINIILNFILINIYGVNGAAVATLITLFILYYVYDVFDKDLHRFYRLKLLCFLPNRF